MNIKPLHIAIAATTLLVLAVPITAYAVSPDGPTQASPTVRTVDQDTMTNVCGEPAGGCYNPHVDPNSIYISDQVTRPDVLAYIIAHETVHFEQHASHRPADECEADRIAMQRTPQYTGAGVYAATCN